MVLQAQRVEPLPALAPGSIFSLRARCFLPIVSDLSPSIPPAFDSYPLGHTVSVVAVFEQSEQCQRGLVAQHVPARRIG
jgi:hypothetical protein